LSYTITDLGTPHPNYFESWSFARAINNEGQVVGQSVADPNESTYSRAFWWDSTNGIRYLDPSSSNEDTANAINSFGQVVGSWAVFPFQWHAFLWDSTNGRLDLGTLGGAYGEAEGINDAGQVVGSSTYDDQGHNSHAFLWDSANGMQDLGTLGGDSSFALGINASGQVVGASKDTSNPNVFHAFLWDSVNGMQDLGTLGGASSEAHGINSFGQVVGWSQTADGTNHAFLWDSMDGMQDLGPGVADGINDTGEVVGGAGGHAALYQDGTWVDLNRLIPAGSRWTLLGANTVNDAGQIVGTGLAPNRYRGAYLLTPDDGGSPHGGSHFHFQAALGVALPHEPPAIVQTTTLSSPPLSAPVPQQPQMETQAGQKVQPDTISISLATARRAHEAVFENLGEPPLGTWVAI
jgi:probable HAF family extracellular repeat protein